VSFNEEGKRKDVSYIDRIAGSRHAFTTPRHRPNKKEPFLRKREEEKRVTVPRRNGEGTQIPALAGGKSQSASERRAFHFWYRRGKRKTKHAVLGATSAEGKISNCLFISSVSAGKERPDELEPQSNSPPPQSPFNGFFAMNTRKKKEETSSSCDLDFRYMRDPGRAPWQVKGEEKGKETAISAKDNIL